MKSLRIDKDTSIGDDDEILVRMRDWFEKWHKGEDITMERFMHLISTGWRCTRIERSLWS